MTITTVYRQSIKLLCISHIMPGTLVSTPVHPARISLGSRDVPQRLANTHAVLPHSVRAKNLGSMEYFGVPMINLDLSRCRPISR